MEYKYSAQTVAGETISGSVEADSVQRAEELLWRSNLTIVSLKKQVRFPSLSQAVPSLFGVKRKDVINFARDLSTMLTAGLPMLRSLDILYRQSRKRAMKDVLRAIIQDLEKGNTFSEACAKYPGAFPALFVRLVRVGEEVGNLASVLEQLSSHLAKEEETAGKIKSSLAYPVFVLCLAFGAVFIMIAFVMPALTALFAEFHAELPALARTAIDIANFISAYYLHILLVMLGLVIAALISLRTAWGKRFRDALVLRIPIIGEASLKGALARTARSMAMMVRSGVPLTEAIGLCADTAGNAVVREKLNRCNDAVLAGATLSQAMASHRLFPPLMSQMVSIGEETGRLDSNLETLAGFYESESGRAVSRLTSLLGPGMIIVVGVIVGFVAVTLFSSIYSIGNLIK